MNPTIEIRSYISDRDLRYIVLALRAAGFKSDPNVWDESISNLIYTVGVNYSLMWSVVSWRYDLHPNDTAPHITPLLLKRLQKYQKE